MGGSTIDSPSATPRLGAADAAHGGIGTQTLPPTHICPKGQHWQGHGVSPAPQVTCTQRFIEQTSSQRHPEAQPAAEQKKLCGSVVLWVQVSPVLQPPTHWPPQPSDTPQRTPAGQRGTHTHVRVRTSQPWPSGHARPNPQDGPPGQGLGTAVPHATEFRSTVQAVAHWQWPATQAVPAAQTVPQVPQLAFSVRVSTQRAPQSVNDAGHEQRPSTQVVPTGQWPLQSPQWLLSVRVSTQSVPQAERPTGQLVVASMSAGGPASCEGQSPTHTQIKRSGSHNCPAGHIVPLPQTGPSGQMLGIGTPQKVPAKLAGGGQRGTHTQRPSVGSHSSPAAQPSSHRPPQPSSWPQEVSLSHRGTQWQEKSTGSQVALGCAQGPRQWPPQPSSLPQGVVGVQVGSQTQWPSRHRSRGERLHGVSQAQVSTHAPSMQSEPEPHGRLAQGLGTHAPLAQVWSLGHVTLSQAVRGRQATWQVNPSLQRPGHGVMGAQVPVRSSQNCRSGHCTPVHGDGKQPAMQRPPKQVCPAVQVTPAHGSRTGTHSIWQRSPPQGFSDARHTSSAQWPCRQRSPRGQSRSSVQAMSASPRPTGASAAARSPGGMSKVGGSCCASSTASRAAASGSPPGPPTTLEPLHAASSRSQGSRANRRVRMVGLRAIVTAVTGAARPVPPGR